MHDLTIDEITRGLRLDVFAGSQHPEVSRAYIQKMIEAEALLVNEKPTKPGYKLRMGDIVSLPDISGDSAATEPDVIDLPILFEDADCVVMNKPIGLLTHARGGEDREASVASFLRQYVSGIDGQRAGIVHRLDRATSGVIIGAKNPEALAWLQKQFSQRKVKKTYRAITSGHFKQPEAIVDMPIERNPKAPATFRVGPNGKMALTHYKVIETTDHLSSVELKPETGRTHQLRVHLQKLGHPIVGDILYGGNPADRLYLHAESLEITLPSRERAVFVAPVPVDFEELLAHDQ
ncbi:RluA family pseudouridine synthase [soil metagenome]